MSNATITFSRTRRLCSLTLLYIFFLTLPGDKLSIDVSGFTVRFNTLLAVILFYIILSKGKVSTINGKYLSFLLFFASSCLASFFFYQSSLRNLAFIAQGLFNLTLYPLITFYFCNLYGSYRVTRIYVVSAVIISIYASLQVFASFFGFHDIFSDQVLQGGIVRAQAYTYEPSNLAIYLIFPLVYLLQRSILHYSSLRNTLIRFDISVVCIFIASFMTTSSTTILTLFIYACFVLLFYGKLIYLRVFKNIPSACLAIVLFLAACSYILLVLPDSLPKIAAIFNPSNHHSTAERLDMSYNALLAFKDRPLFGYGFGGVAENLFSRYQNSSPDLVLAPSRLINPIHRDTFQPMTISTEIISSLGIFGFIGISIFFLYLFKRTFSILGRLKHTDTFSFVHIYSLLVSVCFMCLSMQLSQGFFRLYIIVPIAILIHSVVYHKSNSSYKSV